MLALENSCAEAMRASLPSPTTAESYYLCMHKRRHGQVQMHSSTQVAQLMEWHQGFSETRYITPIPEALLRLADAPQPCPADAWCGGVHSLPATNARAQQ